MLYHSLAEPDLRVASERGERPSDEGRTTLTPAEELGLSGLSLDSRVRKAFYALPSETLAGLKARGYRAAPIGPWAATGRVQAIAVDREHGCLVGGADPRAEGVAAGW